MFKDGELNEIQSQFWKPHPREELFDLQNDYHGVENLADSKKHQSIKVRLSNALDKHMADIKDLGHVPETLIQRIAKNGEGHSPVDVDLGMQKLE